MTDREIKPVPSGYVEMHPHLASSEEPAKGGEPCVVCGEPISSTAHPVQRKRHVCSPRCNSVLKRRASREASRQASSQPREWLDVETTSSDATLRPEDALRFEAFRTTSSFRKPMLFRTVEHSDFPFEFGKGSPVVGDVIERYGVTTEYQVRDLSLFGGGIASRVFVAECKEAGSVAILGLAPGSNVGVREYWELLHGRAFFVAQDPVRIGEAFNVNGMTLYWYEESIRDIEVDGDEYTWRAVVCGPHPQSQLWSPAYRARSERYRRTTRAANSAAARARRFGYAIKVDRIDPWDIFDRDCWTCQVCDLSVNRDAEWPHFDSASLDHVVPISRGGDHVESNLQTTHWRCNSEKGDRVV